MGKEREYSGSAAQRRKASDITNRCFGRLTALYPTSKRNNSGSVIWHCRCECSQEVDVAYNELMYGNQQSCGCKKREHKKNLGRYLNRVDRTCIDILKSKKIPSNNTTGVKGVYCIGGRYVAKIVFQKKQFYLGTYDSIEEAANVRKMAEITLTERIVEFYEKWQERAKSNPIWAQENPVKIRVEKDKGAGLRVELEPQLK